MNNFNERYIFAFNRLRAIIETSLEMKDLGLLEEKFSEFERWHESGVEIELFPSTNLDEAIERVTKKAERHERWADEDVDRDIGKIWAESAAESRALLERLKARKQETT